MIELNLTYEESKKILELGYDFRRVCDRFFIKYKSFYGDAEGYFFKMNDSGDMFPLDATISTYDEVWDHGISTEHGHEEVTPIIPKAALEACLPDLEEEKSIANARVWLGKDLYAIQEDCIYSLDSDGLGYGSYDLERLKDQEFNSAFEAFLWCHENYPEKLKKKFEEVMA